MAPNGMIVSDLFRGASDRSSPIAFWLCYDYMRMGTSTLPRRVHCMFAGLLAYIARKAHIDACGAEIAMFTELRN